MNKNLVDYYFSECDCRGFANTHSSQYSEGFSNQKWKTAKTFENKSIDNKYEMENYKFSIVEMKNIQ